MRYVWVEIWDHVVVQMDNVQNGYVVNKLA